MRYTESRDAIRQALLAHPEGLTWPQLKASPNLPYERPCPNWVGRLEKEIGLTRKEKAGNLLLWKVSQ